MNSADCQLIELSDPTLTVDYREQLSNCTLIDRMVIEKGSIDDWKALSDLHYKSVTLPAASRFWRVTNEYDELVGVIVTNAVGLLLSPRHELFPKLKPSHESTFTNSARARYLNKYFRRGSRVVVDTLYRGIGVSYRFLNLVMRMESMRYMEFQSSMSKYNPFDVKAGLKQVNLHRQAAYDTGIKWFRGYFDAHPVDAPAIMKEWRAMPPARAKMVRLAMEKFYYKNSAREKTGKNYFLGTSRVEAMSDLNMLHELQTLVFTTPVYSVYTNPDRDRDMPDRVPLRAYDWQPTDQPLRLDLVEQWQKENPKKTLASDSLELH